MVPATELAVPIPVVAFAVNLDIETPFTVNDCKIKYVLFDIVLRNRPDSVLVELPVKQSFPVRDALLIGDGRIIRARNSLKFV